MARARHVVVTAVVAVLVLYFLAGLLGALPYNYDIVKRGAMGEFTGASVKVNNWTEILTVPGGEFANVYDIYTYEDNTYLGLYKSGVAEIWQLDSSNAVTQKFTVSVTSAVSFIKFVEYVDHSGVDMLYCVMSTTGALPVTYFYASYHGETWGDSTTYNILDEVSDSHADCVAALGNKMVIGSHLSTTMYVRNYDVVAGTDTLTMSTIDREASALCIYKAPVSPNYDTFYLALTGSPIYTDAGVWYWNSGSSKWLGVASYASYYEVRLSAMTVFEGDLWVGSAKGNTYESNYATSTTIIVHAAPTTPLVGIRAFGQYLGELYMSAGSFGVVVYGEGNIYKWDGTTWNKDYNSDQNNIYNFAVLGTGFYACSEHGKIFAYSETTIYGSPVITHTATVTFPADTDIPLEAGVADAGGVATVVLSYQVTGEILRTKAMTLRAGTGVSDGTHWLNGTYEASIPGVAANKNVSYFITATNVDGNVSQTSTYTIQIINPDTFGFDYRIWYIVMMGLTMGVGYVAYGREEGYSKWRKK